jgi:diguanylate cyclase (GGDEF)-like protein
MIIAVMILLIILIYQHNRSSNNAIDKLLKFTRQASSGNDSAELDAAVLSRDDELGAIGSSVLEMHRSLRDMMDKDALTKLLNRRSANRKLDLIRSHYEKDGKPYSLAIGDIDFFKKVNDTYGHDFGDTVLVAISEVMRNQVLAYGLVSRWGGEEFLIVFVDLNGDDAYVKLSHLRETVKDIRLSHINDEVKVTMTYGLTEYDTSKSFEENIKEADEKLYMGKQDGRDKIVY